MKKITALLFISIIALSAASASAKWWIFGKSQDAVRVEHLFLNRLAFDETGTKLTVYKETLPEGMINIKGKAVADKSKIGAVQVSVDGKEKWEKAKLSDNGAFEYAFKPQTGTTYKIYVKAIDTTGKPNDVDATYKEVTIAETTVKDGVKEALDSMVEAYKEESISRFMAFVSEDFTGDKTVLDRAVRTDFQAYDNLELRFNFNNVSVNEKGMIAVSLNYSRMMTSISTGKTNKDTGTTEFVFILGENGPQIYNMKTPLIFGISDPSGVATGSAQTNIAMTYDYAGAFKYFESFSFPDELVTKEPWASPPTINPNISGEFAIYGDSHHLTTRADVSYQDMGTMSLDDLAAAPAAGYTCLYNTSIFMAENHVYVFKLAGGAYGAIEIKSLEIPKTTLRYKYSPNGRNF